MEVINTPKIRNGYTTHLNGIVNQILILRYSICKIIFFDTKPVSIDVKENIDPIYPGDVIAENKLCQNYRNPFNINTGIKLSSSEFTKDL